MNCFQIELERERFQEGNVICDNFFNVEVKFMCYYGVHMIVAQKEI
jgi:hypothetical protein